MSRLYNEEEIDDFDYEWLLDMIEEHLFEEKLLNKKINDMWREHYGTDRSV